MALIISSGSVISPYSYTAYGEITSVSGNAVGLLNPMRYKGYFHDEESGYYYCKSRYYVPNIGRWLTPDKVKYLDNSVICGYNPFIYCKNNPIMYVDEDGNMGVWGIIGIVTAVIVTIYNVEQTVRTQKYINQNFSGWKKFGLTSLNFIIGYGVASVASYDQDKILYTRADNGTVRFDYSENENYNIFTSFQFANSIAKSGLPRGRSNPGIWLELLGHHIFNSYDFFDVIKNDNQADMGSFDGDKNAWIWELLFW